MQRNPTYHLRAAGNLSYLQFLSVLGKMWESAHSVDGIPTIPFIPAGNDSPAVYPCIYYSLDLRRTHPDDPKMRFREVVDDQGEVYVISGQRFQNIVRFTAITESDPDLANEVIEMFEDFMMEYTPVLKELGASELVYSRRYSDTEENRSGAGVVKRSVSYMLTTEKIAKKKYETLDQISIDARTWLEEAEEYPYYGARKSISDTSPRYYLQGANAQLGFIVDELSNSTYITAQIPNSNFRAGDRLYMTSHDGGATLPGGMDTGIYEVVAPVNNDRFTVDKKYSIRLESLTDPDENHNITSIGTGLVFYLGSEIPVNIVDQQASV